MEAWIKLMDKEKETLAIRAAAIKQDCSDREVSSRWRSDTMIRQRDRLPVVIRELPASYDYIDIADDEATIVPSP